MKANLQSNVLSLDIGSASGMYGNASNFIYAPWNKMPDYALEYVVERDRASSRLKEQTGIDFQLSQLTAAAATEPRCFISDSRRDTFSTTNRCGIDPEAARCFRADRAGHVKQGDCAQPSAGRGDREDSH